MTYKTSTTNSAETQKLGTKLGRLLHGGEFIELIGDLGSGKTTFVKGLAAGLGWTGQVPSPSFTISRVYDVRDGLQLHHFDFYRLHGPDMATAQLQEVTGDPRVIVATEWSANVPGGLLPARGIKVTFSPGSVSDAREILVDGPAEIVGKLKQ